MLGLTPNMLWSAAINNSLPVPIRTLRPHERGHRYVHARDVLQLVRERHK